MSAPYIVLIPLIPLAGAFINGVFGRFLPRRIVSLVGCLSIGASFVLSVAVFRLLGNSDPKSSASATLISDWIFSDELSVSVSFVLDRLSAVMILVVSGVSFLIHVYSIGYMGHDKGYARYFSYLNLFCFAMLLLVLADNLLVMFIGWEGVGLCSYLLIGFWFEDEEKASAGKKAFIVNRIGDFGFLLGIFFTFYYFGTLNFGELAGSVLEISEMSSGALEGVVTLICILLFIGAVGKSAQIPLHVWLPDAMAGPTPVSALIHAATMVTAGVYMIARTHFLYELAPDARLLVLILGTLTAFFAATVAMVQNDIKKVLAYSTISQLGYMFMAMGLGAYYAGIFHLATHAYFKALLFLGAGSVIHILSNEQNIHRMGGLKNYLVITTTTFAVAAAAIAGVPLFSGWFSKDEVLLQAIRGGSAITTVVWVIGLVTAVLTTFYMVRLFVVVFMGTTRVKREELAKLHESPPSMTVPMVILGVFSVFGGMMGLKRYLAGFFPAEHAERHGVLASHFYHGIIVSALSLAGIGVAFYMYTKRKDTLGRISARFKGIYGLLSKKYMVDELYDSIIIRPFVGLARFFGWIDKWIVDGAVNLSAYLARGVSFMASSVQTGFVQIYAFFLLVGLIVILGYLFWIG